MNRKIAVALPVAALVALPLMGAKGCSTETASAPAEGDGVHIPVALITQGHQEGKIFRLGDHVWWIGDVPPSSKPGTSWAPYGKTRLGRQIWIRVPG